MHRRRGGKAIIRQEMQAHPKLFMDYWPFRPFWELRRWGGNAEMRYKMKSPESERDTELYFKKGRLIAEILKMK